MIQNIQENKWAEDLPSNCPPEKAIMPKYEIFYWFVKQFPPTEEDFKNSSQSLKINFKKV
ncbi:hypothetical protein [Candidatus Parabeggiatoa sp. HSG14]|uniref:hypothetical protein n=1 Tax=Candidatus Parabeggiatoa sp. HSG14 TaxID=3055593 RepID=UPI0025A70C4D|nr:hypothetical protein [Thiotrichales bacterium HSG14]